MRWEDGFSRKLAWHRWFAWHPVDINGQTVWLEMVERKGRLDMSAFKSAFSSCWWWEYRDIQSQRVAS